MVVVETTILGTKFKARMKVKIGLFIVRVCQGLVDPEMRQQLWYTSIFSPHGFCRNGFARSLSSLYNFAKLAHNFRDFLDLGFSGF